MSDVAILGRRVGARRAEAAAEGGELGRAQVLIPEDQHRMLGKGRLDPGEGACLEWLRQIDPEGLGSQRWAEGTKLRCLVHRRSSLVSCLQPHQAHTGWRMMRSL